MRPTLLRRARVPCPSCGAENRIGAIFCARCGGRMFSGNEAPPPVKIREVGGPRAALRNAVIALVLLVAVLGPALVLWPFPPVGTTVSGRPGEIAAILEGWAREAAAGQPLSTQVLRETNLNHYLADHATEGRVVRADIDAGRAVLIANEPLGRLTLSTRIVLVAPPGGRAIRVQGAWLGHLPLPGSRARSLARAVLRRHGYPVDPTLFDRLRVERIDNATLTLVDRAAP